jgi:NAD+ synthase (glutamine-hydrolysing)
MLHSGGMRLIKLAAAVLNQTPLDWRGNKERIAAAISAAREAGASVLCLPELCITGYGCEDAFHSPSLHRMAWRVLQEIAPFTAGMVVTAGLPVMFQKGIFNFACVMVDGRIAGFTGKRFLAGDGIHYEPRWFKPWPEGVRAELDVDSASYPCGDLYFEIGGVKFGFEICEDAWVANRPGIALALKGVDIILNPSASHFAFGKHEIRKRFVLEGSRAFGASYVYANLLGNESGRAIFDGEAMIATQGKLCAASGRFSFQEMQVITAQVDVDATRMNQARTASYHPNLAGEDDGLVSVSFDWPVLTPEMQKVEEPAWEQSDNLKAEEFSRAVPLALLDYARKSRSRGFVVSLSGGADSAACAVLVRLMVELALQELGAAGLRAKLSFMKELAAAEGAEEFSSQLLTTAYQASDNSGHVTSEAAKAVAAATGARHFELNIAELVKQYTQMVEGGLGRELTWHDDDIALQNIQARVRSPGIWMLANIGGALLLSTSNRSEAAVGYATMDGDTSGGLAPIAGIDKAWLREWLAWMETKGPHGLHAFPALKAVNAQAPTAELRPPGSKQTDEDDLMPYPLLDAIERAAIRDKLAPLEVWQHMRLQFPQYERRQLAAWVERFFRLWCRNQWKRERFAPAFHLDDENLDPKTWCRFPILSGGFEVELEELRTAVNSD